jgi:hypothetical protein
MLLRVPVRRPGRQEFVRVHADPARRSTCISGRPKKEEVGACTSRCRIDSTPTSLAAQQAKASHTTADARCLSLVKRFSSGLLNYGAKLLLRPKLLL